MLYKNPGFKIIKKDFSNQPTPLQYIEFSKDKEDFCIFNLHGAPFPEDKLDTSKRIEQSKKILDIMDSKNGTKILVGDFNLLPETESIKMIENKGYKNLIEKFNIDRTRSFLGPYWKGSAFQKFADYAFVSVEVKIKSFKVPHIEISDHLPLILEFDIS